MLKTINDLFKQLENASFASTTGPLEKSAEFLAIKDLLYERLAEDIPERLIDKHGLQNKRLPEDKSIFLTDEDDD